MQILFDVKKALVRMAEKKGGEKTETQGRRRRRLTTKK